MRRAITAWTLGTLGVLILMASVAFLIQGTDFFLYRIFGPRQESARREIFEQTKSYNEGMQQELQSMAFQYQQTDDAHRAALASIILDRVADYDLRKLHPDLQRFIERLRSERLGGAQ